MRVTVHLDNGAKFAFTGVSDFDPKLLSGGRTCTFNRAAGASMTFFYRHIRYIQVDPFCVLEWHDWCGGTRHGYRRGCECPCHDEEDRGTPAPMLIKPRGPKPQFGGEMPVTSKSMAERLNQVLADSVKDRQRGGVAVARPAVAREAQVQTLAR